MPIKRIMLYVISYDIVDDKRRNRVRKFLQGYGERVQYSVFECWLTADQFETVLHELGRLIELEVDSIRAYRLCAACADEVLIVGQGRQTYDDDAYIV